MRRYQRSRVVALDDPLSRREEERRERFLEQVGQQLAKLGMGNATPPALQVPSNINPPPGGPPLQDHDHSRSGMGGNILGDPTKTILARGIWHHTGYIGVRTPVPQARLHVVGEPAAATYLVPYTQTDITTGITTVNELGGTPTYESLNEGGDDPTESATFWAIDNSTVHEVRITQIADPGIDTGFILHVTGKLSAGTSNINFSLQEGATTIASTSLAGSTAFQHLQLPLTDPQCLSITDYSNLRIRFSRSAGITMTIYNVWLEIPIGAGGGKTSIFQADAAQAESLMEFQNSVGSILSLFTAGGSLGIGTSSPGARLHVAGSATTDITAILRAITSQTANLLSIQNVSGTNLLSVTAAGRFTVESGGTMRFVPGAGTTGHVLASSNTSGDVVWAAVNSLITGAALTRVDDTNVTLTLGGTPATALLQAVTLTLGWTGQLAISRGGTGASTALGAFNALSPLTTRGDLLTRDASNNVRLAIGAAGRVLGTDGTDPSWINTITEEFGFDKSIILKGIAFDPDSDGPTPSRPSSGYVKVLGDSGVGVTVPMWWPADGRGQRFQGNIGWNGSVAILPGTGTAPNVFGTALGTISGTASHPAPATTNYLTQLRRTQVAITPGAGGSGSIFENQRHVFMGNAAGRGGFYLCTTFSMNIDPSLGNHCFVGLYPSTATIGNNQPSSLVGMIGIGCDAGDTNYHIFYNDSTPATASKDDTGIAITSTTVIRFELRCLPNGSDVFYRVTRLDDTSVPPVTGTLSSNLPSNTTLLGYHCHANHGADIGPWNFAHIRTYLETDV